MLNLLNVNSINKAAFMSTYITGHLIQTWIIRKQRLYDSRLSLLVRIIVLLALYWRCRSLRRVSCSPISSVWYCLLKLVAGEKMDGLRGFFSFILVVFAGSLIWNVNAGIIYKAVITNGTGKYITFKDLIDIWLCSLSIENPLNYFMCIYLFSD